MVYRSRSSVCCWTGDDSDWRARLVTAGALQFPRKKFLITILIARSIRYYTEGVLAVYYGERVLRFLRDNGLMIVMVAGGLCVMGLTIYLVTKKGRAAVKSARE